MLTALMNNAQALRVYALSAFVALSALPGCHNGLYRAVDVLRSEGVVAPSMKLLTPVSERSPLGVSVKRTSAAEAVELAPEQCFWIKDVGAASLDRVVFTDTTARSLDLMLGAGSVASAGLKLTRGSATSGVFTDVKAVSGTGVFDGNRCETGPEQRFLIVTSALSGTLHIDASVRVEGAPQVKIPIPDSPVQVQLQGGESRRRKAVFSASEPVFFAAASSWVTVKKSSTSPAPIALDSSKQVDFPAGFSGDVTLMPFDAGNMEANFTVNPDTSVSSSPPEGFTGTNCALRTPMRLPPGSSCYVWLGNAVVILKISLNDAAPALRMDAYRTTLVQPSPGLN